MKKNQFYLVLIILLVFVNLTKAQHIDLSNGYWTQYGIGYSFTGTDNDGFVINKDHKHNNSGSFLGLVADVKNGALHNQWNIIHRHNVQTQGGTNWASTVLDFSYYRSQGFNGNNRNKVTHLVFRMSEDVMQGYVPLIMRRSVDMQLEGGDLQLTSGSIDLGGDLKLKGGKSIKAGGNGNLNFTGFSEYRFDRPLSDPNSNLVLNDGVDITNELSFGESTRQMINLWRDDYGIGVQSNTQYFRSDKNFAWYRKGNHSNGEMTAGLNGILDMALTEGDLGIGLNNPQAKLDVNGTSKFRGRANFDQGIEVSGTLKNGYVQIQSDRIEADGNTADQDLLLTDNDGINLRSDNILIENRDGTTTDDQLTIRSTKTNLETNLYGKNGTVTFKDAVYVESENGLTVAETINAQDLNITPGAAPGAPDYVFEKDYKLMSLEQVEKHIKKKGHLPEVPSAKKIEEEGYTMVEMDFTLLKKVEELTLYILEIKKQNDALTIQSEKLTQKNQDLQDVILDMQKELKELQTNRN